MFSVSPTECSIALCCHGESCRGIIFKTWMQAAAAFWLTSSFTDQERDVLLARQAQLAWAGSGHLQPGPWKTGQAWGLILAPGLGGGDQRPGSFPGTFPDARLSSCLAPACPSGWPRSGAHLPGSGNGGERRLLYPQQAKAWPKSSAGTTEGSVLSVWRLLGLLSLF